MTAEEFEQLSEKAKQGDTNAAWLVGHAYLLGNGVEKDEKKAATWLKVSAESGHAFSQFFMGLLYTQGNGVEQDYYAAAHWYQLAADQNEVGGLNNLGVLYANGLGVEQSYSKAAELYSRAAELGDPIAMTNLANYYFDGTGVQQDVDRAYELYKNAADKNYKEALVGLARCYEQCAGVRDPDKAFELYSKAAETDDAIAIYNLAECYNNGTGTAVNAQKALELYEKAAMLDYLPAQMKAANIHWEKQNYTAAVKYYRMGQTNGDEYADYSYAFAVYHGMGIKKDEVHALFVLRNLCNRGNKYAQEMIDKLKAQGVETNYDKRSRERMENTNPTLYMHNLDMMNKQAEERRIEYVSLYTCKSDDPQTVFECGEDYFYGRKGKTQRYDKAALQYEKAARLGHVLSMYKAGLCCIGNDEKTYDPHKKELATEWFKKAADAGYRGALKHLLGIDKYLKMAADYGDPNACLIYGKKCKDEGDLEGAVKWFDKGYKGGNQECLAQLRSGIGDEFFRFTEQRANAGEAWAQYDYAERLSGNNKTNEAVQWYKKAAEQGFVPAYKKLAVNTGDADEYLQYMITACESGMGECAQPVAKHYEIIKDFINAARYYEIAVEYLSHYNSNSYRMMEYLKTADTLADIYCDEKSGAANSDRAFQIHTSITGIQPVQHMTDSQLKELEKLKQKHTYRLAHAYHYGLGCKVDYSKAEEYYRALRPDQFVISDRNRIAEEVEILLSRKCKKCGNYFTPVEGKGLFGAKVYRCNCCGAKVDIK